MEHKMVKRSHSTRVCLGTPMSQANQFHDRQPIGGRAGRRIPGANPSEEDMAYNAAVNKSVNIM